MIETIFVAKRFFACLDDSILTWFLVVKMQRRSLLVSLAAMGGALTLNQATGLAAQGNVKVEVLAETDPRVKTLLSYIALAKINPAEAIAKYVDPKVTYTSTTGQRFNKEELIKRLDEWNKGFEFEKLLFEWAILAPDGAIVASIAYDLIHSAQFRGSAATQVHARVGHIFEVSFDKSGKIENYKLVTQYDALASIISPASYASLLGIR
jgi:hypothetical protein